MNRLEQLSNRLKKNNRGATMIEMAIVTPIILLIILGIIYFGLYYTAHGMLGTAAQRALSVAAVVDGLDSEVVKVDGGPTISDEKRVLIEAKARELAGELFGTNGYVKIKEVRLVLPSDPLDPVFNSMPIDPRPSLKQGLQTYPMQVIIRADLAGIAPFFPAREIEVRAAGYRENRSGASLPATLDCTGRPAGTPLSALQCICFNKTGSTTPPNCGATGMALNTGDCSCYCANDCVGEQRRCVGSECPANNLCQCRCNVIPPCEGGTVNTDCDCDCSNPHHVDIGGVCQCPQSCGDPARYSQNSDCSCTCTLSQSDCQSGRVLNAEECRCACPAGQSESSSGACECVNDCTDGKEPYLTSANVCSCRCPNEQAAIADCQSKGGTFDSSSCKCQCPNNSDFNSAGKCECDPCDGTAIPVGGASCACTCKPSDIDACNQLGGILDGACNCSCPAGQVVIPTTGKCGCPTPCIGGNTQDANCNCVCLLAQQGGRCPGSVLDVTTCSCACPNGLSQNPITGACICNITCGVGEVPVFVESAQGCVCRCNVNSSSPAAQYCRSTGGTVQSDCSCRCPNNRRPDGAGGCVCGECTYPKVLNSFNCTCQCDPVLKTNCRASGGRFSDTSCLCTCPDGRELVNGSCVCPPRVCPGSSTQNSSCECVCNVSSISCNGGIVDPTSCSCNCPDPRFPYDAVRGGCFCPLTTCPNPSRQFFNASNCSCECRECPPGLKLNPSSCECSFESSN